MSDIEFVSAADLNGAELRALKRTAMSISARFRAGCMACAIEMSTSEHSVSPILSSVMKRTAAGPSQDNSNPLPPDLLVTEPTLFCLTLSPTLGAG